MHVQEQFLSLAKGQGMALVEAIAARDEVYLAPAGLTRAAMGRLRKGLRLLEAYLRRLILLMALKLEPELAAKNIERPVSPRRPSLRSPRTFRIFNDGPSPDWPAMERRERSFHWPPGTLLPAGKLLARLEALTALAKAPEARARRLAWVIARRRPGQIFIPDFGLKWPHRLGAELGLSFLAMGRAIPKVSAARPPPLGPPPRPPPRARRV